MNKAILEGLRRSKSVITLLVGTIFSLLSIYGGWYLFAANIPIWKFVVGVPAFVIGFGFLLNNISSFIRHFGFEGKVGKRFIDLYRKSERESHDDT